MKDEHALSRRDFLRLSALTAVGATLAACGPQSGQPGAGASVAPGASAAEASAAGEAPAGEAPAASAAGSAAAEAPPAGTTEPIAPPSSFKEAPMLAAMVEAGDLPAVAERLPKSPYVPPHAWLTTGKYGGAMNWTNSWGGNGVSQIVVESMYGHSPLRWLRDGLEIGPGLAESWETNDDTTEWTFKFRDGLKWSDGEPWTVNDIMFWWDDMVNVPEANEAPPDEARSGTGTLAKFEAVDDYTLKLTFDAPAPLTADRIAMWVNNSTIGPRWHVPRHYAEQFHPKYNSEYKDFTEFTQKIDGRINPDYPVMSGWKLKDYQEGSAANWERNPYYWVVDKEGNQLPYVDTIRVTGYQDKEVEKVNYLAGKADFTHHWVLTLADVAAAMQAKEAGGFDVRFWDSGDGTGQAFFLNWDFKDDKMRELIRNTSFRKGLSHAYNRAQVQKDFYFNRGEQTSGTYSPKAIEYNINDEGKKVYAEYRDYAVKYDPEMAKQLLDEAGVKAGSDGKRTMPDGSPLLITLDYTSDQGRQVVAINERLAADFNAVGVETRLNPMPSSGFPEKWLGGDRLTNAQWGVGDGPNHLVYPQWLVPIEQERWAPMTGQFYKLRGTDKVSADLKEIAQPDTNPYERNPPRMAPEEGDPVSQLWEIYDKSRVEPDAMARHKLVWDMIRVHVDNGPFFQGAVSNAPYPILVKNGLTNVPKYEDLALGGFCAPWIHPTPAVYDPETWFWDNPDQHA